MEKRVAVVLIAFMLAGSGLSSYATAVESIRAQVIDADLRATMSEASPGEKLSVEVTLPDLDASDLEDQIDLEEAVQFIERGEECPPIYNLRQMLSSSDLELDGDTMQELIMVQRRSYAELYEEWSRRPSYSVTEGDLPNISVSISSEDGVDRITLNESTTSLQIAELTASNSGKFYIAIRLLNTVNSDVFYSYSYVIQ